MVSSTKNQTETIFDYLVANPSSTTQEVSDGIDMDLAKCRALMTDMFRRGKLERKVVPNPMGYHKTTHRYWTTSTQYFREKTGRKPKSATIEIPDSWGDTGIDSLVKNVKPIEIKQETSDNTIKVEVTVNITAHRLILDVLQQMSKNL